MMATEHDIIGYVLDALEPEEMEAIEAAQLTDSSLREAIDAARKKLRPLAQDDFIESPPDLASRTFEAIRAKTFVRTLRENPETEAESAGSRLRPLDICVALAMLLLIGTMVMPALVLIRGDQQRMACSENLRRLGTALAAYTDLESGFLPYVAPTGPASHAGVYSMALNEHELIPDPKTLICPGSNSAVVMVPSWERYLAMADDPGRLRHLQAAMGGSYGYSLGYFNQNQYHGLRRDRLDGNRPLVSDRPARAHESEFVNSPNHAGRGQNVLFADGSVRWLPQPTFGRDNLFLNQMSKASPGLAERDTVIRVSEEPSPFAAFEL